jgi:antitoxin CptB
MLELDLLLQKFLDRRLDLISAPQVEIFKELLEFEDNDLLDMLMGRAEPADERLSPVLEIMRTV